MIALAHDERKPPRLMKNESLDKPRLSAHSSRGPDLRGLRSPGRNFRSSRFLRIAAPEEGGRGGGRGKIDGIGRWRVFRAAPAYRPALTYIPSRNNVHNQLRSRDAVMKAVVLLGCSAVHSRAVSTSRSTKSRARNRGNNGKDRQFKVLLLAESEAGGRDDLINRPFATREKRHQKVREKDFKRALPGDVLSPDFCADISD